MRDLENVENTMPGAIQDDNYTSCQWCPKGQVCQAADGTGLGSYISGFGICTSNQKARFGKCKDCDAGYESSRTGIQYDHVSCVLEPPALPIPL